MPVDVLGNYKYADGVFYDIRPDAATLAEQKRKVLLEEANVAMAPLQDASDLGIETDEERMLLNEWKKYRVSLNRLTVSNAAQIVWPVPPASR
ncbi:tail fiber assembly protein [Enterobacter hormaechei]